MNDWILALPLALITKISNQHRVDPALVAAIVSVESSGKTEATRYEKHYRWLYKVTHFANLNKITKETEEKQQKMSWGLGQVMGAVAREYGFSGNLSELTKPEIGLQYCIKHLTHFIDKYDNVLDGISAYNQGSPRLDLNGNYENYKYVDKVNSRYETLKYFIQGE